MMTMALAGVSAVAVCSDSDHHQRRRVEAAAVDVDDGESPPAASSQLSRRSAKYQPTTWDYDSICSLSRRPLPRRRPVGIQEAAAEDDDEVQVAATSDTTEDSLSSEMESVQASLKDSVRRLLLLLQQQQQEEEDDDDDSTSNSTRSNRRMLLIRTIHQLQSLGIAYHFSQEIRDILMSMHHDQQQQQLDLHSAALLFRMLRGLGIPASADMVMRALREEEEDDGKVVAIDRDGLLALYQASYLAFPEETVLDQARAFAAGKLAAGRGDGTHTHLSSTTLPLHWRAPRLQAMWSLKEERRRRRGNDDEEEHHQQLAEVDFNLVQAVHRRELAEVTRWWKEESRLLNLQGSSFARDRVVECFFCAACIAPEPHLAECREVLAKTGALIVHLDDIYDVYGTMDELQAFTDAIASSSCHDDLPEYMKAMYSAILTTSATAADRVLQKHGYDMLPLYKKAWHELCKAFLVEAQWQQQQQQGDMMPSFAEYVSNGWVTSTGPLLLLHALPAAAITGGGGSGIDYPRLVELSSTIFRLCNDCAERGDAPSSIACCMAEPWCAGEDQARAAVQGVIAQTWKALNWEVVVAVSGSATATATSPEESLTTMANLCQNLARIIHCIYQDGDGITSPTDRMKQMVKDLLFNPIDHVL